MKPKLHTIEITKENDEFIVSGVYTKHDDPYGFHEFASHAEEGETHDDNNPGVYRKQIGKSHSMYSAAFSAARKEEAKHNKPITDFVWLTTAADRKIIEANR